MLRRLSLILAVVMLLGLIAACGDDDDDEAGSDSTAETAEVAATATLEPEPTAMPTLPAEALPATPTTGEASGARLVEPPGLPEGIPHDGRVLGDPDAAVQIVEYGDFQ